MAKRRKLMESWTFFIKDQKRKTGMMVRPKTERSRGNQV